MRALGVGALLLGVACTFDPQGVAGEPGQPPESAADAAPDASEIGFSGTRLELPCGDPAPGEEDVGCLAAAASERVEFGGAAGTRYRVTLRFRGVVEQNEYQDGVGQGFFYVEGAPAVPGWNVFSLSVSSPERVYYLNAGSAGILNCFAVDYEAEIEIDAGATLEITADAIDGRQVRNIDAAGEPIVVPGVPPAPAPFDGQFLQADVLEARAL